MKEQEFIRPDYRQGLAKGFVRPTTDATLGEDRAMGKRRRSWGCGLLALVVACGGKAQDPPPARGTGGTTTTADGASGEANGGTRSSSEGGAVTTAAGSSTLSPCVYQNVEYPPGAKFTDRGGCTHCTCLAGGSAECMTVPCTVCSIDGLEFFVGETYELDSCNTCRCDTDGTMHCSMICNPNCSYNEAGHATGDTFLATDGCNQCTCERFGVSCTTISCVPCTHEGKSYGNGEYYFYTPPDDADRCFTCGCQPDGTFNCVSWCPNYG